MTLLELSVQYRAQADALKGRMQELDAQRRLTRDPQLKSKLSERIDTLAALRRETGSLAVLLERYYERGYRRNGRYTL